MPVTYRIGFRGDERSPEIVLKEGFSSRKEGALTYSEYGDSVPEFGVSLSTRLSAASYFPLSTNKPDTWIYVVYTRITEPQKDAIFSAPADRKELTVSTENSFANIHGRQVIDSKQNPQFLDALFADELAVKKIDAGDILCAVQCKRLWADPGKGGRWQDGGKFELSELIWQDPDRMNPDIGYKTFSAVKKFIQEEIKLSKKVSGFVMPSLESGFSKNDPRSIEEVKSPESFSGKKAQVQYESKEPQKTPTPKAK